MMPACVHCSSSSSSSSPTTLPCIRQVLRNVGYDKTSWYLDNLNVDWQAVYSNEPCHDVPTDALCAKILGGHGEMWGETVDASDIEQTVWPRLAVR